MGSWRWAAALLAVAGLAAPAVASSSATRPSVGVEGWTVAVDAPAAPAPSPVAVADPVPVAVAQQRVVIPVLPGGLRVSPAGAAVVLHRVAGNRYEGSWGPVRVVDARGSLVGWAVAVGVSGPVPGRMAVVPDAPVALTGRPDEVVAEQAAVVAPGRSVPVMAGVSGGGGGTFAVGGRLELTGGSADGPDSVTVSLLFTVA